MAQIDLNIKYTVNLSYNYIKALIWSNELKLTAASNLSKSEFPTYSFLKYKNIVAFWKVISLYEAYLLILFVLNHDELFQYYTYFPAQFSDF